MRPYDEIRLSRLDYRKILEEIAAGLALIIFFGLLLLSLGIS